MDFSHLQLEDIDEGTYAQASRTSQDAYALLDRIRDISLARNPASCEVLVLTFLSRVAIRFWVDGDLRVEIHPKGIDACEVILMRDMEDVFEVLKRLTLKADFGKFHELGMDIKRILPFMLVSADQERLVFEARATIRRCSLPPPAFAKADQTATDRMADGRRSLVQPQIPRDFAPTLLESEAWRYSDEAPTLPIVRTALPDRAAVTLPGMPKKPDPTPEASASDDIDDGWDDI